MALAGATLDRTSCAGPGQSSRQPTALGYHAASHLQGRGSSRAGEDYPSARGRRAQRASMQPWECATRAKSAAGGMGSRATAWYRRQIPRGLYPPARRPWVAHLVGARGSDAAACRGRRGTFTREMWAGRGVRREAWETLRVGWGRRERANDYTPALAVLR